MGSLPTSSSLSRCPALCNPHQGPTVPLVTGALSLLQVISDTDSLSMTLFQRDRELTWGKYMYRSIRKSRVFFLLQDSMVYGEWRRNRG